MMGTAIEQHKFRTTTTPAPSARSGTCAETIVERVVAGTGEATSLLIARCFNQWHGSGGEKLRLF